MHVRVGLIGYGGWTRAAYVPALLRDGRARIVSAAAPSAQTRQRIGSELDDSVATFEGAEALLNGPRVDAVFIAVPEAVHEPAMSAALDAGVAIFYEPPLANERRRIRQMITRLAQAPQVTHADLEIGYIPVVAEAAQRVRNGDIGRIHTALIRLQSSWNANPQSDLCTVHHLAPWYVDPLNRILNATPRRVLLLDGDGLPGRAQLHSQGLFDYDGAWATFQANLAGAVDLETTIEVNGDDGDLIVDIFTGELRTRTRRKSDWSVESVPAIEPRAGWPGMHETVTAFLDSVLGGAPSAVDARTVAQLHLVGLAAEASKDSGSWATVEHLADMLAAGTG